MTKIELLVVLFFAAVVFASEGEDSEQKKRGAGKTTTLNTIPTGAQKPDFTYNIYSQNPSTQSVQTTSYQSQVPNSFYPSLGSQYNAPSYTQAEQPSYSQPPQINLIPPTTSSQFVPLNFIPNPGYQAKYQIVPSKTGNGNIQYAILQQPQNYQSQILQYPQTLLSSGQTHQFNTQQSPLIGAVPQGQYNVPNYQPLSLGGSYLGQPSTMLLLTQPNPSLYNNLLYQNPLQSVYNYYPSNTQARYNGYSSTQNTEYEKVQSPQQSISKEDNDISVHNTDYVSASDSNYKNAYAASRSSYTKLK